MRVFLAVLLSFTALSVSGSVSYGEVTCAAPTDATAETAATPAAAEWIPEEFPEEGGDLHVYAAASLTDAYGEIADNLMEANPNLNITIETAGSQTLVTQLEEGASADVLATANTSTMDRAVEGGLIAGDPVTFTGNRLVIVTPADNPAGIETLDDLAVDGVRLVLANPEVPVGNYSMIAFCDHEASGEAADGFIDGINSNIASEEPDVRHVLTKVQLGEADAGVVYASDATASMLTGVELNVIEFPESVPTRAEYPIGIVADGNHDLALAFITYVLSPEGQEILAKYGFE